MITVVTWLWQGRAGYVTKDVLRMRDMVREHYARPHRFLCVSDQPIAGVETVAPWNDFPTLPSPAGPAFPSCYRRLRAFHPDIGRVFGDRFVMVDLDALVVADLAPLWDRSEDFVGWRDPLFSRQLCGSMLLMSAGARPHVWTEFDPHTSPQLARRAGFRGSDQAWMSYWLMDEVPAMWTDADGVLSYRAHARRELPEHARIVFFHGRPKAHEPEALRTPWVAAHALRKAA